jgi:uncharacterized membrane protein
MNKMLIAVFDNEKSADTGLQALHRLHINGDITLYAARVMLKDANGKMSVKESVVDGPVAEGTIMGLAVGSLIGMLGGPAGMAIGAAAGTLVGAVRDFWMAGVGIDFIEEAESFIHAGKVAVVAEIEEEWVIPVDSALEAVGGQVFRRTRTEVAESQFDHSIAAFKSEIKSLEDEASHATGEAKEKLRGKIASAKSSLVAAMHEGEVRVESIKHEADAKAQLLKTQLTQAKDEAKTKLEERVKRVKSAYHVRGAKLSEAWHLAKQAIAP